MHKRILRKKIGRGRHVPHTRLGQHFLTAASVLTEIVNTASINPNEIVLEVGPGKGILTEVLLTKTRQVVAVEKDTGLVSYLSKKFMGEISSGQLKLIEGDIRNINLSPLFSAEHPFIVVANIPYYLTGELLRQLLSGSPKPSRMVLLVQKEVAIRIARSKKESVLSLSVKAFGEPRYVRTVRKGSFSPPPKIDSAIIAIEHIRNYLTPKEERVYFDLIHAAFSKKRGIAIRRFESEFPSIPFAAVFETLQLPRTVRPEDMVFEQWIRLTRIITKNKHRRKNAFGALTSHRYTY